MFKFFAAVKWRIVKEHLEHVYEIKHCFNFFQDIMMYSTVEDMYSKEIRARGKLTDDWQ